jgi:hypothetical protein
MYRGQMPAGKDYLVSSLSCICTEQTGGTSDQFGVLTKGSTIYWLWGWGSDTQDGFIKEGTQGTVHAPPLTAAPSEEHRAKLRVRHYRCFADVTIPDLEATLAAP